MRLLLDTCIVAYMSLEPDRLSQDVLALIEDYDNQLCVSIETVKELIVAYRRKGLGRKLWKKENDIIDMLTND
ncbi:MAG: toxin PIN, partial [Muribaculaceae bacterium]